MEQLSQYLTDMKNKDRIVAAYLQDDKFPIIIVKFPKHITPKDTPFNVKLIDYYSPSSTGLTAILQFRIHKQDFACRLHLNDEYDLTIFKTLIDTDYIGVITINDYSLSSLIWSRRYPWSSTNKQQIHD